MTSLELIAIMFGVAGTACFLSIAVFMITVCIMVWKKRVRVKVDKVVTVDVD